MDKKIIERMIKYRKNRIIDKGHYHHSSIIYIQRKNRIIPICFGFNHYIDEEKTLHAEIDVLLKLKKINKKTRINIMVIRFNHNDELRNSKPCSICINNMNEISKKKNYIIDKVLYSIENDLKIIKYDNLFKDENKHVPKKIRNLSHIYFKKQWNILISHFGIKN
jgi:cytidine deaminase